MLMSGSRPSWDRLRTCNHLKWISNVGGKQRSATYGYAGLPKGLLGEGWVRVGSKPVWVYESPL